MIVNSHQDSHASSQRNEKERIGPGGSRALAKYVQEAHASALAFSLTLLNHQFIRPPHLGTYKSRTSVVR
jgi:hypothetical protein